MLEGFIQEYVIAFVNRERTNISYKSVSEVIQMYACSRNISIEKASDIITTFMIKPSRQVAGYDWLLDTHYILDLEVPPRICLQAPTGAILGWVLPVWGVIQPREV